MHTPDPSPQAATDLDALIRDFADAGCEPSGAVVPGDRPAHGHGHAPGHGVAGVRSFRHRGHEVRIATRYEITIDGEPWDQQLAVRPDGTVTYHGLPTYVAPSALDVMRAVVDTAYEAPEPVRAAIRAAREAR